MNIVLNNLRQSIGKPKHIFFTEYFILEGNDNYENPLMASGQVNCMVLTFPTRFLKFCDIFVFVKQCVSDYSGKNILVLKV